MINYFKTVQGRMERLSAYEKACWIDMVNPSDDEIEDIAALTGIDETLLKAALDEEESARLERDDNVIMCLMDTPVITDTDEGDIYETIPLSVISNKECLVTVSLRGNPVLGGFVSNRVSADTTKPTSFLLSFMMGNAKVFLSNLRQIDKSVPLQPQADR